MRKTFAVILAAAAIANAMAEDGSAPTNAAEHPDLTSLAIPQTFTYELRDVYLTREIEVMNSDETGRTRYSDTISQRTETTDNESQSRTQTKEKTDLSQQDSFDKTKKNFNAGGELTAHAGGEIEIGNNNKFGVPFSFWSGSAGAKVEGRVGGGYSRDWGKGSTETKRKVETETSETTDSFFRKNAQSEAINIDNEKEIIDAARLGKYHLKFSVMLQNRDSSDTLIADGHKMLAMIRGPGLTGTISVPYRERDEFRIEAGVTTVCVFDCAITDANQLHELLLLRKEDQLNLLRLDVSSADFPIVSEKTKTNVLAEQKAAELRRPSTLIAVDFGEMEKFSPWCVSRRHTKESGQRGKPVTLREALQAVEAVVINQSDTLNGFAFSEEGHLVQIDDRPLLDKNGDYRMFAARFEQKDGTTELHLPTSEVLKRNIQDYSKISFFDSTFDEFAEMAVLFPTYFSPLRKEIEEWLAKADDKEAAKTLAGLLEKRQKEDDVRDLPKDKESITKADAERFRLRAEAGVPEMQYKYARCLFNGWGVASNHVEAAEWLRKAAEQGNPVAQNRLGVCYGNGIGVTQDFAEAVNWFRKAADQGYAWAQNNLGDCYYSGEGVTQDFTEAAKWYRKAAEQGHKRAQDNLGNCYYSGKGVTQDFAEAVNWYRKAADQGYARAQDNLGNCYYNGEGVTQEFAEAVNWYRKAAEQGLAWAQDNLGNCYYNGEGVTQDFAEAVNWYRKAAEQGLARAQHILGNFHYNGIGVMQDFAEAVKWYRKAADQGEKLAQYCLGICYSNGKGVTQDYSEAVKWYRKAAVQGYPKAQATLGNYYTLGKGVEQDSKEAAKWFQKAADQGDAWAQYVLGHAFYVGSGVKQDYAEAVKWYRKAAEQGLADAQYVLGMCYEKGKGVACDWDEAEKWYQKAADQGYEKAKQRLEEIEREVLGKR